MPSSGSYNGNSVTNSVTFTYVSCYTLSTLPTRHYATISPFRPMVAIQRDRLLRRRDIEERRLRRQPHQYWRIIIDHRRHDNGQSIMPPANGFGWLSLLLVSRSSPPPSYAGLPLLRRQSLAAIGVNRSINVSRLRQSGWQLTPVLLASHTTEYH